MASLCACGSYSTFASLSRITGYPYWVLENSDSTFHWGATCKFPVCSPSFKVFLYRTSWEGFYFSSRILGKEDCFFRYYNWFLNWLYFLWVIWPGCTVGHHCNLKTWFLSFSLSYNFLWHDPEIAYNYYLFTIIWTPALSFSYKHAFL